MIETLEGVQSEEEESRKLLEEMCLQKLKVSLIKCISVNILILWFRSMKAVFQSTQRWLKKPLI